MADHLESARLAALQLIQKQSPLSPEYKIGLRALELVREFCSANEHEIFMHEMHEKKVNAW